MPLPSNLATVSEADVLRLITAQETEGPHLEFKRELPRTDNGSRHEFLADVSAFANSGGGDVVFGIEEDDQGRAASVVALAENPDQEPRRLLDVLMNGVEPRLPGVHVQPIAVTGGSVFVLRVPQSWAGPHRVKTNQHFFLREGPRKRQLDVPEIRSLFLRSDSQAQKVRDFRTDRLGKLIAGETPIKLVQGAVLAIHLVPTQAALGLMSVDPVPYLDRRQLPVLGAAGANPRLNIDGVLTARNWTEQGTYGYAQFFRNGFFESVYVLITHAQHGATLGSVGYEEKLIALVRAFRNELAHLGFGAEITMMLSIIGAKQVELGLDRHRFAFLDAHQGRFDRDTLVLPDVILPESLPEAQALRPVFDLVWQAAGLNGSINYNSDGEWAPQR